MEQEPFLQYEDGSVCSGIVSDWDSGPTLNVIKNRPLKGYTRFQKQPITDESFNFTLTFSIDDCGYDEYKKFTQHIYDVFTFFSEWGGGHVGCLTKVDPSMIIENKLYRFSCSMATHI